MTPEQALAIVIQTQGVLVASGREHDLLRQAISVLSELVQKNAKPDEKPAPAKKA